MSDCTHEINLNETEDFVFCSKCGKRWVAYIEPVRELFPAYKQTPGTIPCTPYYGAPLTVPTSPINPNEVTC